MTPKQITGRPTAAQVTTLRQHHGYTQLQCATLVCATARTWQKFEATDEAMPLSTWWLFLLRLGEITPADLPPIPGRQRIPA